MHHNAIVTIERDNTITSSLASKLSRKMIMITTTYGKDNHYICKAASLPALTPETILEMINCSWRTRSLDNDPASLKSVITVLNFRGPPVNQGDYRRHVNMETRLANSCREEYLGQHVEHSKPKTIDFSSEDDKPP